MLMASHFFVGVEQLVNLQHLDVAYNLLLEHAQLAPLSTLHYLNKVSVKPGGLVHWRCCGQEGARLRRKLRKVKSTPEHLILIREADEGALERHLCFCLFSVTLLRLAFCCILIPISLFSLSKHRQAQ